MVKLSQLQNVVKLQSLFQTPQHAGCSAHSQDGKDTGTQLAVSSLITNLKKLHLPKSYGPEKVYWNRGLNTHTHTSLGQKHTVGGEAAKRAGALLEHLL